MSNIRAKLYQSAEMAAESINVQLAMPALVSGILAAWPTDYDIATEPLYGTAITAGMLVLLVEWAGRQTDSQAAKKLQNGVEAVSTGMGTAYFSLTTIIALYIALYAVIGEVNEESAYLPDSVYAGALVAPSLLLGASHALLEYYQPTQNLMHSLHLGADLLADSSMINLFLTTITEQFGISEQGDVDPSVRLSLFLAALIGGLGVLATKERIAEPHKEKVEFGLLMFSTTTLLASTFLSMHEPLGQTYYFLAGALAFQSLLATVLGFKVCQAEAVQESSDEENISLTLPVNN